MKNSILLLSFFLLSFIVKAQQPVFVTVTGPNPVSSGETATYTTNIPVGDFIAWNITNGAIQGSANPTSIVTNSNSITIQWNKSTCGTSSNGSITVAKFSTWPPSAAPSHIGTLSVTIKGESCPEGPSCASFAKSIETVWNNPSIPQDQKCNIIKSIYNAAINSGLQDTSCLNLHGCQ